MAASLLPIPDDPRFPQLVDLWPAWAAMGVLRSVWLKEYEGLLREFYPSANSDSLTLTARTAAPFYIARPNEP